MRQSQAFIKTKKLAPHEAECISHKYLTKGHFIERLASGIFSLLPLGLKVHKKIENIIREEMDALGAQEIFLPVLSPKRLWQETSRWKTIDPPLFKLKDRHRKEMALNPTHEEIICDIVRKNTLSTKHLPFALYQIQDKFRNELRATGGLLRTREFVMKDLYSFHATFSDLDKYYNKVLAVYKKIFKRLGLNPFLVEASSGTIGGKESCEFMVLGEVGEDKLIICGKCGFGANLNIGKKYKVCPKCKGKFTRKNGIEVGHTFKLGDQYSKKMQAFFVDKKGEKKPLIMGCYGIGLGRIMAAIVEVYHDQKGIIWPKTVAPYLVHLISLLPKNKKGRSFAERVYNTLQKNNIDVLYDDRDESPGVKLFDGDLIGIPIRLVVSQKTVEKDACEFKLRSQKKIKLIKLTNIVKKIKNQLTTSN